MARRSELSVGDEIGGWKVDGELGRGGVSIVYSVNPDEPELPFERRAAKILSPDERFSSFERLIPRFRLEQWLTNRFIFSRLATGDYGENDCVSYIMYNEVFRGDLKQIIRSASPYPVSRDLFSIALDIMVGVAFLHANGVIHRDLCRRRLNNRPNPPVEIWASS